MYVENLIKLILSPSSNYLNPITIIHTRLTNGKSKTVTERLTSWMYVEKVSEYHETSSSRGLQMENQTQCPKGSHRGCMLKKCPNSMKHHSSCCLRGLQMEKQNQ